MSFSCCLVHLLFHRRHTFLVILYKFFYGKTLQYFVALYFLYVYTRTRTTLDMTIKTMKHDKRWGMNEEERTLAVYKQRHIATFITTWLHFIPIFHQEHGDASWDERMWKINIHIKIHFKMKKWERLQQWGDVKLPLVKYLIFSIDGLIEFTQ